MAAQGVECVDTGERPSHGRLIVRCMVNGKDLGAMLVREGLAISETQFGDRYHSEEVDARRQRVGVWR
jgi:endonuclease YncB( thermonuclease family)